MIVKLKIAKLQYFDEEQWFLLYLVTLNAVGWPPLLAALWFWGPT